MNLQTDFDGLNINVDGVELTGNDLTQTTSTGSIFNLTVAGAANWNNTGLVTETYGASHVTNITGARIQSTTTTIDGNSSRGISSSSLNGSKSGLPAAFASATF